MNPQTKFFLNVASIVPTGAIVASWNSLPGDTLYSTKRSLETVALAITSPNYQASSELQTRLIARRTDEATDTILKKSSSKGLDELRAQLRDLNRQIAAAPTAEAKQVIAKKAVTQLKKTRQKLAQTKTTLAQGPTIIHTTTTITERIIQQVPAPAGQTPPPGTSPDTTTPTTAPTPQEEVVPQAEEDLIVAIEATEEEIEDAIEEIEEGIIAAPPIEPSPSPADTSGSGQGQGQGLETAPGQQNDSLDYDDN